MSNEGPDDLQKHSVEAALPELRALRDEAQALYRREAASLRRYVRVYGTRTVIARSTDVPQDAPVDPAGHATCTCFVASHFAASGAFARGSRNRFAGLHTEDILQTIVADFEQLYAVGEGGARLVGRLAPNTKAAGPLPNSYSTPLHLCGLAAALSQLSGSDNASAAVMEIGWSAAQYIADLLATGNGFIMERDVVGAAGGRPQPHAYQTFWCVRAIVDWLTYCTAGIDGTSPHASYAGLEAALARWLDAHVSYLSRILVADRTGIGTTFDADDIVGTIASVAIVSRRLGKRDEFIDALLPHAIDVLLDGYVHKDGSFVPNAPILHTKEHPPVTVSTEELNALLLHAVADEISVDQAGRLRCALEHARRKAGGPRGWGGSVQSAGEGRTAFVSSAALSFLMAYHAVLDRLIAGICSASLGVRAPDPGIDRFELPAEVAKIVEVDIQPMVALKRRNLAVTSLVLAGARSVPKERIAAKIANMLDWPILTLDPVSFLGDESSGLDLEIRRNLDLLSELSDTVVFFDALDDWLRAPRHSATRRLLSYSMLGRLDQLTATGRILVVIACEDPKTLKLLDDRAGRVDTVVTIGPPSDDERRALLAQLYDNFGADADVLHVLEQANIVSRTAGFTEGYIRELVRACVARQALGGPLSGDTVRDMIDSMKQRVSSTGSG